jgi:hypothetical protein
MLVEWNFNLGTILPLVFAAGIFYAITKADMKTLKENIVKIDRALEKQTETIAQISVQKSQLENLFKQISDIQQAQILSDKRLYDLSRGRGWVHDRDRQAVDGEYP